MKKTIALIGSIILLLCGCEMDPSITAITMTEDNDYYETDDWTLESLTSEFEKMGFTNIILKSRLHNVCFPRYIRFI